MKKYIQPGLNVVSFDTETLLAASLNIYDDQQDSIDNSEDIWTRKKQGPFEQNIWGNENECPTR